MATAPHQLKPVREGALPNELDPDSLASTLIAVVQGGCVLCLTTQDPGGMTRATQTARDLLERMRP